MRNSVHRQRNAVLHADLTHQLRHVSLYGALFDPELNWRTSEELLEWLARGVAFVVIDHASGEDITRVFLAHWSEGRVVDPVGTGRVARC